MMSEKGLKNEGKDLTDTVIVRCDGYVAEFDIDTLWIDAREQKFHWKGRVCKVYALVKDEWKMTMHSGVLEY